MPADTTTAPTFATIGDDTEPTAAAVSALARLLLAVANDTHTPINDTPSPAEAVASVFQSAVNME